jgi:hypothetical protein
VPSLFEDWAFCAPVIAAPPHGVEKGVASGEAVMKGLTPALSISVEPRGIVPPVRGDPGVAPGAKSGDAMPVEDAAGGETELHWLDNPPPSKPELGDWLGAAGLVRDWAVPVNGLAEEQERGLRPPGLISVEASGMPVGVPEVGALNPPRGDVARKTGRFAALCA